LISVTLGGSALQTATGNNYIPELSAEWNEAEFNVFGNGGGSQVVFNSGATLQVRTEVISGASGGSAHSTRVPARLSPDIVDRRVK